MGVLTQIEKSREQVKITNAHTKIGQKAQVKVKDRTQIWCNLKEDLYLVACFKCITTGFSFICVIVYTIVFLATRMM